MRMDPPSASSAATAKGRCDSNDQSAWPPLCSSSAYDAAHERTKFRSPLPLPPLPLPALASDVSSSSSSTSTSSSISQSISISQSSHSHSLRQPLCSLLLKCSLLAREQIEGARETLQFAADAAEAVVVLKCCSI